MSHKPLRKRCLGRSLLVIPNFPALISYSIEALPNVKVIREMLLSMNKYLPNERDFSAKFGVQVIKAQKYLLDLGQVKFVHGVQQYRAISAKRIWKEVKTMGNINKYFPDFNGNRVP